MLKITELEGRARTQKQVIHSSFWALKDSAVSHLR